MARPIFSRSCAVGSRYREDSARPCASKSINSNTVLMSRQVEVDSNYLFASEAPPLARTGRALATRRPARIARTLRRGKDGLGISFLNRLSAAIVGKESLLREARPWSVSRGRGELSQHALDDRHEGDAKSGASGRVRFGRDRRGD